MANTARDLLRGAIDLHVHSEPDIIPRLMDDLELAEAARRAGMGGILLKNHFLITADRAQIASKVVPDIKIFGGLVLNGPACGGLNADAVRTAIGVGAKAIWLPTNTAVNYINCLKVKVPGHMGEKAKRFVPKAVPVLDAHGSPLPELIEILKLVADANIILGTGHLSAAEIKVVAAAALQVGVKKILVNHPELWHVNMSIADQRELAARGVMLERCIASVTADGQGLTPMDIADQIRAVGVETSIMATDYGQVTTPPVPDGFLWYIEQMLECGIPARDIETMVKVNPGRLLDLQ